MPDALELIHHGGRFEVTGSCHELRLPSGAGLLVDCGLKQGNDETSPAIDFAVGHIAALVLTHVHLDHCGRIPWLLAAGFDGPILCSEPSALLLPAVIEDALKVGVTRDRRRIEAALEQIRRRVVPLPYGRRYQLNPGNDTIGIRLQPAGHILGSAWVDVRWQPPSGPDRRVVFSGDLGAPYAPLLPAPKSPWRADLLVLESTYGNRLHADRRHRRAQLKKIIEQALADRGTILIPAFSIGRTQELLYEFEEIIHRHGSDFAAAGLPWQDLEVIVDSPLASRFTALYRQLRPFWDAEAKRRARAGRHPLDFEQLTTIDSHADHQNAVSYLRGRGRPCVVIAASGMCTGGRVVDYLKALIGDDRTDILFCGYQAEGTPGRQIQDYGPRGGYVVLDKERYDIRARVHTLPGYSAHADRRNLVNFVRRMRHKPKHIRLVHGEAEARRALTEELSALGIRVD